MKCPLSEQLRPTILDDFFGQTHILQKDKNSLFSSILAGKKPLSLLFWGPPGCGKTTLAKIYMKSFLAETFFFHPASHGIADIKKWVHKIQEAPLFHRTNILFIDEIHRLNKAQQDTLLPFLEDGTFILVGATTENPSFSLANALLSRLRVIPLKPLEESALYQILEKAISQKEIPPISSEGKKYLVEQSQGDARHLLNCLENLLSVKSNEPLSLEELSSLSSIKPGLYDKSGEEHFNLISALHKSIRGSDPDAALYWISRMLAGGEDPNYIARRLVRVAIEDIGLAAPSAQTVALNAWQTYERLGSPEADLALAEAAIFLALCPKSNACYTAFSAAKEVVSKSSHLPPPKTILNAPTKFMEKEGYGKGYIYDPDAPGGFSGQNYFPDGMQRPSLYNPQDIGDEREMKKRKEFFTRKREELSKN